MLRVAAAPLLVAWGALACRSAPRTGELPQEPRTGEEISICGELVPIGTPVVLWHDPGGYSAYRAAPSGGGASALAYRPGRAVASARWQAELDERGLARADLERIVDQVVIHYDACGLARTCFRVLSEERGLSAHFLLDLDGTLYQTLDLADQAWHARQANPRSIGIEIANVGAAPLGAASALDSWYARDEQGTRVVIPEALGDGGLRIPGFVARPARAERIAGVVNGQLVEQWDFTPEQYEALAKLTAALVRSFPRLSLEVPRCAGGPGGPGGSGGPGQSARAEALTEGELAVHCGLLGHCHVTREKLDPGPAFDWERLVARAAELLAAPPTR
jgi:hypothetical protein